MKKVKKMLSLVLMLSMILGTMTIMNVGAATPKTTGTTFGHWINSTSCMISVKNIDAEKYQYMLFTLGGTKLKTETTSYTYYSNKGSGYESFKVTGIRPTMVNGMRVRAYKNGAWGAWSNNYYIVPAPSVSVNLNANSRTAKISWKSISGVSNYVVQMTTSPSGAWYVTNRTSSTSVNISKFRGSAFKNYVNYYYRVIPTRSIKGVTYKLQYSGNTTSYRQGYFYFYYSYK